MRRQIVINPNCNKLHPLSTCGEYTHSLLSFCPFTFDPKKNQYTRNTYNNILTRNGKWKDKEYINNSTKITIECDKGHLPHDMTPGSINNQKSWCACCSGKCTDVEHHTHEISKIIIGKDGSWESGIYVINTSRIKVRCSCGYLFETTPNQIQQGGWCPPCSKRSKDKEHLASVLKKYIDDGNYWTWVSGEYVNQRTHILLLCKNGHRIKMTPKSVKKGSSCPCCVGKCFDKDYHTRWLQYIVKNKRGKWTGGEYVDSRTKITLCCQYGHTFETIPSSLKQGSWCSVCSALKSERECSELLKLLTGYDFIKTKPDTFINPRTGYCLELDGYCEELHLAFEYQGKQHYFFISYFHGDDETKFLDQQYRDALKKEYCTKYKYKLLEIPYTMNSLKKKYEYIVKFLRDNDIAHTIPDNYNIYSNNNISAVNDDTITTVDYQDDNDDYDDDDINEDADDGIDYIVIDGEDLSDEVPTDKVTIHDIDQQLLIATEQIETSLVVQSDTNVVERAEGQPVTVPRRIRMSPSTTVANHTTAVNDQQVVIPRRVRLPSSTKVVATTNVNTDTTSQQIIVPRRVRLPSSTQVQTSTIVDINTMTATLTEQQAIIPRKVRLPTQVTTTTNNVTVVNEQQAQVQTTKKTTFRNTETCPYIFTKGKRMGQVCGTLSLDPSTILCYEHRRSVTK